MNATQNRIQNQNQNQNQIQNPASPDDVLELVRAARAEGTPLYPVGGGTSLDFGLPARRPGWNVDLTGLSQIVDYPAADMTITVQAGIRMDELDGALRTNRQQLPLDVPRATEATLGGVLATNFSGPRRLGYGTARDFVIGIRAVDGHANAFAGGGRVVKNVAGYDFCKLLIGSLGTLGIVTEVTLKLKPRCAQRVALVLAPADRSQLQRQLAQLIDSPAQPVAADWLVGPTWTASGRRRGWPEGPVGWVAMLLEGQPAETTWMREQIQREWAEPGAVRAWHAEGQDADELLSELSEFPAAGESPLVLKANVRPSGVLDLVDTILADAPDASVQAHAVNGVLRVRLPEFPPAGLGSTLIRRWQPAAIKAGGNLVVLANPAGQEMTSQAVWGTPSGPLDVMHRIKQQFDPNELLNPGRFVY